MRTSFLLDVLPGEASPTYISGTPQQSFRFQAPMAVLSLMRSVGTPLGFANEEQPWVAPVKKPDLAGGKTYSGNAVGQFANADLFTFQDLTDVARAK